MAVSLCCVTIEHPLPFEAVLAKCTPVYSNNGSRWPLCLCKAFIYNVTMSPTSNISDQITEVGSFDVRKM